MSKLIIVQRQTLDWASMTPEKFTEQSKAFCQLWGRPDNHMVKLVDLWNQTFAINYFSVREKMKEVARKNITTIKNSLWIPYEGYANIPKNDDIYLFIDDDDWLRPDITQFLSQSTLNNHVAVLWKAATFGAPNSNHPVFFWGLNGRCMTNNYAVNGRWLSQGDNLESIKQHGDAEKTLKTLENNNLLLLDEWLSMTNKHPCSSVSLERGLQSDFSSQQLVKLINHYCNTVATIKSDALQPAPWSEPLINETKAFFNDVKNSRI